MAKFLIIAPGPSAELVLDRNVSGLITIGIGRTYELHVSNHHLMIDNDPTIIEGLAALHPNIPVIWQAECHRDRIDARLRSNVRLINGQDRNGVLKDTLDLPTSGYSLSFAVRLAIALSRESQSSLEELNVIGVDFQEHASGGHYFKGYPKPTTGHNDPSLNEQRVYFEHFFETLIKSPHSQGAKLWNLSPDSLLQAIPRRNVDEAFS